MFCPNCGSPQLKFAQQEEGETGYGGVRPPGAPPRAQGISWKDAILAALLVAVPAGLLSAVSVLSWGCCLWVVGGAVLAIVLYHRRAPGFLLETRSGVRIGAVAGLIAAYSSVIATAIWRVFARYVLHQGYAIDQFYDAVIQQSTALVKTNPDAEAQWHAYCTLPDVPGWAGRLYPDQCGHHFRGHHSLFRDWGRFGRPSYSPRARPRWATANWPSSNSWQKNFNPRIIRPEQL